MDKKIVISKTQEYVKKTLGKDSSGHDYWHVHRVWQMAKHIGEIEKADMFIVELGALLHDIADYKFHGGDEEIGATTAEKWLKELRADQEVIDHVKQIVRNVSFKGAKVKSEINTLEGKVVQDADRLDAIGSIGIARSFAYGGHKGSKMYDPEIKPIMHETFESYKNYTPPTITHFYEKLLLLRDLMNTKTARKIAIERHRYMETFLNKFYKEWEGIE